MLKNYIAVVVLNIKKVFYFVVHYAYFSYMSMPYVYKTLHLKKI